MRSILWDPWWMRGIAYPALGVYVLLALGLAAAAPAFLFHPRRAAYPPEMPVVHIPVAGETMAATYLAHPSATPVLLYCHGNGETLGDLLPRLEELRDLGCGVFAYDYAGYGASTGMPAERRCYQEIDAAYRYLTQHLHIPPARIIVFGRSMGGGPAVDLAARRPVGGLILQSCFTSLYRLVPGARLFPGDLFDNLAKIRRLRCPLLVIHGSADRIIPIAHGQQLLHAAPTPKSATWVPGAGHNDLPEVAGEGYAAAIQRLLAQCTAGGPPVMTPPPPARP